MVRVWLGAGILVVLLAGCFSPEAADSDRQAARKAGAIGTDLRQIGDGLGEPIEVDHDHRDGAEHIGGRNLRLVSWSSLDVALGFQGFNNFVFFGTEAEDLIFIAIDGRTTGGFIIVDIKDPAAPQVLGRYNIRGTSVQEVRVIPGGEFVIVNVQSLPPSGATSGQDCTVCIQVVDVRDRERPTFVSALPVEPTGTHNMDVAVIGGSIYVFYVVQTGYTGIARFVEAGGVATLVPVAQARHMPPAFGVSSYPHDVVVQTHPLTGQSLAYVSHWEGGAFVFDVSNPAAPVELGGFVEPKPDEAPVHWMIQEERARTDGRVIVWETPEILQNLTGSGLIRAFDATTPGVLDPIGSWDLPGNVTIQGRWLFTPHIAVPDFERGLLAVAHDHGGVWVLNISNPTQPTGLAYYFPAGNEKTPYDGAFFFKAPFGPDGFLPNVFVARWHQPDGLLWVSERGTGLYALEYTGPIPGKLG